MRLVVADACGDVVGKASSVTTCPAGPLRICGGLTFATPGWLGTPR